MTKSYHIQPIFVEDKKKLICVPDVEAKRPELPPFFMVGRKPMGNSKNYYPLLDIILDMNAAEKHVYRMLKSKINPQLIIRLPPSSSQTERNKRSKGIQELVKKKLIKKIFNGCYMLNPLAHIFSKEHEQNVLYWESLP